MHLAGIPVAIREWEAFPGNGKGMNYLLPVDKSNDFPSQSQSTMIQPVFNKENLNLTGSSLHEFNHYCNVEFFVYACMILVCLPPPQVALHSLHSVHSVHTGHSENHKVDLNYILSKLTLINKQHVHREAMSTGVT